MSKKRRSTSTRQSDESKKKKEPVPVGGDDITRIDDISRTYSDTMLSGDPGQEDHDDVDVSVSKHSDELIEKIKSNLSNINQYLEHFKHEIDQFKFSLQSTYERI